ncbi:hypothetical protein MSKOL_3041 [Methanosarcina sp. Kolksee]|uniref:type II toxin-antitoxin system HicB family antitoxin n=1 Tax=Methanosarcina sp. Kolksee TaxID=1434099 RepID=UPI0006158986|nr:type II toxin-antitoxin system HicB family antitoxin [Methanosarcina sp. Kolksee]AKB48818.1 hypothetical protein MSKOL_3041 [Methanosarcina sp. Kolksee]
MEGKSLNYTLLIEKDEDGIYIAKIPDIPGCYTQGKTVERAMERIRETIQVCPSLKNSSDIIIVTRPVFYQNLISYSVILVKIFCKLC